jgi:cytochrome c-type biogenesis protein CcmH
VSAAFVLMAVVLALATAGILVRPLLRRDPEAPESGAHSGLAIAVVMLVLGAAPVLYLVVGSPEGIGAPKRGEPGAAEAVANAPDMETAIAQLEARLQQQPADLTGWVLLGRSYRAMQRFEDSRRAFERAMELAPDEPDVLVDYAEAVTLANPTRRFGAEALELLQRALGQDPSNERGLLLLGVARAQVDDHAGAVEAWERLDALLPPDSDARRPLRERINESRAEAGLPVAEAEATQAPASPSAAQVAATPDPAAPADGILVTVELAPELASRIAQGAALFVLARDPEGSPAPVAVRRLPPQGFPLQIALRDSDRMVPGTSLTALPALRVSARISQTGNAAPAPGDLEAEAVDITPGAPARLRIARIR